MFYLSAFKGRVVWCGASGVRGMGSVESRLKDVIDEITMMGGPEKRMLHIFLTTICRDFVLAWSARGGVGFLPHLLKLIRLKRCGPVCRRVFR